jgi:hypothetical protein
MARLVKMKTSPSSNSAAYNHACRELQQLPGNGNTIQESIDYYKKACEQVIRGDIVSATAGQQSQAVRY